jgi:hypothetical protein
VTQTLLGIPDGGKFQWTSEESADQAWEEWVENEDAMALARKIRICSQL